MKNNNSIIRSKVLKGLELAFQKLLQQKANEDSELVYEVNGKIVRIKAKNMIKQ
ncbi:MAG: hypothetical protein PHT69_01025 [Bacteroidales bacterium]|nr:hypothetical protein [Bacteroidales bacterium]